MLRGVLIFVVVGILAVLSHRRSRLEERVFKNVPLSDWLIILVFPILLYLGWLTIVRNIIERPYVSIFPLDDFDILAITILFLVYGFVGNAIHFNSKILWRYLKGYENTLFYRVNEMFHDKLSHYLAFLNGLFIIFLLPVLELNHPLTEPFSNIYQKALILGGAIFGISSSKGIFYTNEWFGGYNKPLFFIVSVLLGALIVIMKYYILSLRLYPVSLLVFSIFFGFMATFVVRQIFIFTRLSKRKKLRFLAKILHA